MRLYRHHQARLNLTLIRARHHYKPTCYPTQNNPNNKVDEILLTPIKCNRITRLISSLMCVPVTCNTSTAINCFT